MNGQSGRLDRPTLYQVKDERVTLLEACIPQECRCSPDTCPPYPAQAVHNLGRRHLSHCHTCDTVRKARVQDAGRDKGHWVGSTCAPRGVQHCYQGRPKTIPPRVRVHGRQCPLPGGAVLGCLLLKINDLGPRSATVSLPCYVYAPRGVHAI